jgi:para-aminobenzoate synthetase/4-amino-4-deoxychorismate lyase
MNSAFRPFAVLQRNEPRQGTRWCCYADATKTLTAYSLDEVLPLLDSAARSGLNAVGWIAYEAAPAFDPALCVCAPPPGTPLARFTFYQREENTLPPWTPAPWSLDNLRPLWDEERFSQQVAAIRAAIAAGETYQVNLTYPLEGHFSGDPWGLFRALRLGQAARHQAFLHEEDQIVLSASPELFFHHRNGHVTCRPMKGTAPRHAAAELAASAKNRAENVMIVDMIRNDLGKIARPGSVRVPALFSVEDYPSLAQMTSTVEASGPDDSLAWLSALFPCASITGAPKRNTMDWIRRLEQSPRGLYTGAIGGFFADGSSEFNVAIRTAVIRRSDQRLRYHTGCGIVWDSEAASEYRESQLKTRVLTHPAAEFQLIETLRWTPEQGIPLWPRHRARLLRSTDALGFALDSAALEASLAQTLATLDAPSRLRLLVDVDGHFIWSCSSLPPPQTFRFILDNIPTPRTHPELVHKTTRRNLYDAARARHPEADEVLLVNEAGELMEFCIGSLVLRLDGQDWTPPLSSGLLPGVAREQEIAEGRLRERVLFSADLHKAESLWLLNALRGRVPVRPTP